MTARSSSSNRSSWTAVLDVGGRVGELRLDVGHAQRDVVEPLRQRLLETFHLDADQNRLADRGRHLLLQLIELFGVDLVHLLAHRLHPVVDRLETGVEAGHPVVQCDECGVEAGGDAADVGVDLGDPRARVLLDPHLGGQHPLVETVLDVGQAGPDHLRGLGLHPSGVALRLVESRREGGQASFDVGLQLLAQLGGPLLHRLGHLVEVGDHPGRLLVEAAQVGVEGFDPADEAGLVVADLLQGRTCDVLHHAGEVGVHVVEAALRA